MSAANSSAQSGSKPHDIERGAAEWVLRLRQGLTSAEEQEFDDWLQSNERHAEIFAEMNETSRLLDQLRDPALAGEPLPAVASSRCEASSVPLTNSSKRPSRRFTWIATAGLAAAAAVAIAWVTWSRPKTVPQPFFQSASTEVGGLRKLSLPDGSFVDLNTGSVVEVGYTATERRVRLKQGEAFFTVARNPQRPFWVDIGTVSVRAVGTAFNVRYRPEAVEVLVKEGKVSVSQTAVQPSTTTLSSQVDSSVGTLFDRRFVVAGEKAVISLPVDTTKPAIPMTVATMEPPRIESTLAWQMGRLEFTDTPLSEVVAEFNRYNRHQLVIVDRVLAAQTFAGAFAPTGYDSLVEVLEQGFGVVAERRYGQTILRRALPPQPTK